MKNFIKIGNISSKTIQKTVVFLGMILVFFFVVYFVKYYSVMEGLTTTTQMGDSISPVTESSPAPAPSPSPSPSCNIISNKSTSQIIQVVD